MIETYIAEDLGLPSNFAFLCVSGNNLHGTVRRDVFNNKNVYFERKILLNDKWWEDKEKICVCFLSQKTNKPVRLQEFQPDSCNNRKKNSPQDH